MAGLAGGAVEPAPPEALIDNAGVDVVLCGISARAVRPGSAPLPDIAAVRAAWAPEFADPDRLQVLPACALDGAGAVADLLDP